MIPINLVHALPNAWLPEPGQLLRTKGLSVAEAQGLMKERAIASYIRYEDTHQRVLQELEIDVPIQPGNCPSPLKGDHALLCLLSPGTTEIKYVLVYDGGNEDADHAWRHSMTEYA